MRKAGLACLIVLAFVASVPAEVTIKKEHRITNFTGVQCFWCATETAAYYAQRPELYNITVRYRGWVWTVKGAVYEIKKHGVEPYWAEKGAGTVERVKELLDVEKIPVIIVVPGHALLLTHLDDEHAYVIDNSGPFPGFVQVWHRETFDALWLKGYVAIPRRKEK